MWAEPDLKQAFRTLTGSPGFALVSVASLALGLGATSTGFTLVDAVLFRELPGLADQEALVAVYGYEPANARYLSISFHEYESLSDSEAFSGTAAYFRYPLTLVVPGEAERLVAEFVTASYFETLGTLPILGRALGPADATTTNAVVSEAFFRTRFGSDPSLLGRPLRINGQLVTIVGVAPPGFGGVLLDWHRRPDIWLPVASAERLLGTDFAEPDSTARIFMMTARLGEDVPLPAARAAMQSAAVRASHPNDDVTFVLMPIREARFWPGYRERVTGLAAVVLVTAVLTLLAAAVNLLGLFVARLEAREHEIALRVALGASRRLLGRLVLAEAALVVVPGAVLGLWLASYLPAFVKRFPSAVGISLDTDYALDARAVIMTVGLAVLTVLIVVAGAVHLTRVARVPVATRLKGGLASTRIGVTLPALVVVTVQVGFGVMLVVGALFSGKSLWLLSTVDTGFQSEGVVTARIDLSSPELDETDRRRFYDGLLDTVRGADGVESAALVNHLPSGGVRGTERVSDGPSGDANHVSVVAHYTVVSPGFFDTLRIPVLGGRDFSSRRATEVVVNRRLARLLWPTEYPVGQPLRVDGEETSRRVVGLVSDARMLTVWEAEAPHFFLPLAEDVPQEASILIRTSRPFAEITTILTEGVRGGGLSVPLTDTERMDDVLRGRASSFRLVALLTAGLSASCIFLACIGLFALVSSEVTRRRRELAIRAALGADPAELVWRVHRLASRPIITGLLLGLGASYWMASGLTAVLFGVSPADPLVFIEAATLLILAVSSASHLPARRAEPCLARCSDIRSGRGLEQKAHHWQILREVL